MNNLKSGNFEDDLIAERSRNKKLKNRKKKSSLARHDLDIFDCTRSVETRFLELMSSLFSFQCMFETDYF